EIRNFSNGVCVEMEGGAVAQVAHLNACPFVIIRCISDMAAEDTAEYKFNEATAGDLSARFVEKMLDFI
ncbi:MAG: 5'-methylthioadenosine/adenosylhomocysteine nucleosidase, partial [Spirochaetaceae bacterium]|nr:5'-methylthioadenosine/adenosylhomocysteine nucleosidase [Spirochaetaceae bacterium]